MERCRNLIANEISKDKTGCKFEDGGNELVKTIVRDLLFLGQKSEETTQKDGQVIQDLQA